MKISRNFLYYLTIALTAAVTGLTLHVLRHFLHPAESSSSSERTIAVSPAAALNHSAQAVSASQSNDRLRMRTKQKRIKPRPPPAASIINTTTSLKYLTKRSIPWAQFLDGPKQRESQISKGQQPLYQLEYDLITCPAAVVEALSKPALTQADVDWCKWAISSSGGRVVVGKSWGNLAKADERARFDSLNCNAVGAGNNPSCDDAWGDNHVRNWKKHRDANVRCKSPDTQSDMECYVNENKDKFCVLENVMIDFSKAQKVEKGAVLQP